MCAAHIDTHYSPLFHFGYGLSYTTFDYSNITLSSDTLASGETISVCAEVRNTGSVEAEEVVQLYVRDLVGSVTRPVKELEGFKRVRLSPGHSQIVSFTLDFDDLAFFDRRMTYTTEAGEFQVWIGGSSEAKLMANFKAI